MRNNLSIIVAVIIGVAVYAALSYFGLSFWLIILALVPISYVQIYLTNRYNFRDSVELETIPQTGFEKRIAKLNTNHAAFSDFGFTKIDEFYMKLSPDALVYTYRHDEYPITMLDYDLQILTMVDLVTQFDNGWMLTTSNSKHAGATPVPEDKLLQVFQFATFPELLRAHMDALQFLQHKGFRPSALQSENYRQAFMDLYRQAGEFATGILSPIRLIYRAASGKKKRYFKSIREQHLAGSIQRG